MTTKFTITIEGEGPLVDGWEKRLGIQREDLVTKKVWSSLRIKKTSIATVNLDRSLDGVYDLLPDCGTAFGSLHKQRSSVSTKMLETTLAFFELQTVDEPNYRDAAGRVARSLKSIIDEASALCDKLGKKRPLYLFLDPERIGKSQFDRFVFSTEKHRTVFEETRYTVARIDASWRPSERRKSSKICTTYGRWMGCEAFLSSVKGEPAESAVLENGPAISMYSDIEVVNIPELQLKQPSPTPESAEARFKRLFGPQEKTKPKLRITNDQTAPKTRNRYYVPFHGDDNTLATITYECKEATVAVLVCTVPNVVSNDLGMQSGPWAYITQSNQRHFYEKYAWLVERSRELDGFYNGWRASRLPNCSPRCPFCAPEAPTIRWIQNHNKIEPIEDHHEAALFEKCVKERPVPIVLRGRIDEQGTGRLEIGLNLPTLAHRALGKILNDHKITGQVDFHWRLDTKYNWPTEYKLNSFSIRDNKDIEPIAISFPGLDENGNPHTLRIEQQRSLGWMKGQEAEDGLPFQRQEIEEALAPQMNWRAEVRVRTPQTVLGGVLADEVGYGKTATTLALVHLQFENEKKSQQGRAKGKQRQETKSHETTCPGYIQTDANLFIVPKTIFMQWGKEITKFLGDSYTVIQLSGYKHLEGKTIREFRKAHIVLACSSLFTDRRYWENSARFAGLPEANTKERRAYTAWLKDVRSRSQEHVEIMKRSVSDLIAHLKELETAANNSCEYRYAQLSRRLTGAAYVEDVKNSTSKEQKQRQFTPRSYKSFEIPAEGTFEDVECPSLEIFKWRRVIGDEHQHYEQYVKIYFSQGLQAGSRWILSATPKMDDFADIRNMMRMVNVDIGIDDDAPGVLNGDTITEMRKLMTFVERFWTFNETHSPAWHQGRQAHAQVAMNQFVRKNLAEISEIPMKTHIRAVSLSTEELVRYVEHQQRLESHEMRIVFAGYAHIESDLTQILNSDIAGSTSGPELLVKLASFFTARESSPSTTANHKEAQSLVSRRKQEVDQLMAIIEKDARHAAWLHEQCHRSFKAANEVYNGSYYSKWKDNVLAAALGDHTACGMIAITIKKAEKEIRLFQKRDHYRHRPTAAVLEKEKSAAVKKNKDRKARHKTVTAEAAQLLKAILTSKVTAKDIKLPVKKPRKKKNVDGAANVDDAANVDGNEVDNLTKTRDTYIDKNDRILYATTIRKVMIELRRYSHELVSRLRALRFDACAQDLQLWKTGDDQVEPPRCGMEHCHDRHNDPNDIVLNSTCGHLACRKCIASQEDTETCPYKNCDASTEAFRLNTADDLTGECHNTVFGSKIDAIVNLLLYEIPEDEQALLFVQYEEMMGKIEEAFDKIGISNWALRALATDSTSRKMTDDFQDNTNPKTKKKVLILNSSNETSAGL